jgi:hypothetical protein
MEGAVTSYAGNTLTLNVDSIGGSGNFSGWSFNVAGPQGATGPVGPVGPLGPAGPVGPGYAATSTTSAPINTGGVTLSTQSGLAYTPGARARLASRGTPSAWMEGVVTSYSGGNLTVNVDLTSAMVSALTAMILPNHLSGLALANDTGSPYTVIDIAIGSATADDNSVMMLFSVAGFKKNINAAFVAGSGNGALDTGTAMAASTWYHIFLIQRPDTGQIDVLASTSATAPAMPTSYTKKRRIGSIYSNTSTHIRAFTQLGNQILYSTGISWEVSGVAVPAPPTWTMYTLPSVPPGVKTIAILSCTNTGPVGISVQSVDSPTVDAGAWNLAGAPPNAGGQYQIRTDTSQRIQAQGVGSGTGLYIAVIGYIDPRGT